MKLFYTMKTVLLAITLSTASLVAINANADILKHVETKKIGIVINHAVSPDGKYMFSTTISPTKLYVHSRNPNTGRLTLIQTLDAKDFISGIEPSFYPEGIVVSPDSKQLYISATFGIPGEKSLSFDGSVLRFDISSTGTLTYKNRVITNANIGLTMTSDGKFLYVGTTGVRIAVLNRASNGNISKVEILEKDLNGNKFHNTEELTISPDNKNLYVSSVSFDGHLYVFSIDQTTGKLINKKSFIHQSQKNSIWDFPEDVAVSGSGGSGTVISNDGRFFYSVGGYGDERDSITIYNRSSDGSLTFLKNILAPTSDLPSLRILYSAESKIEISPNQKYLFAHDSIMANIGVWKRNTATGDLSFVGVIKNNSPASLNNGSNYNLVLSKDGQNLYLNAGDGIVVYDLRSDLSIVKTDAIDPVNTSGTIDYTLAITNEMGSNAYNVKITDTLPAGSSFISGTVNSNTGSCSANGQTVICTMGMINSGSGYNAVIKVRAPSSTGIITNTATVISDQLDTNMANNTDTETTTIGSGGGTTTPPKSNNSGGGGSMPFSLLLMMLFPMLLRNKATKK